MTGLVLVSHVLCPYVQRAAIALAEKGVAFERRDVDLSNKPDWFIELSPLGRVPLLLAPGRSGQVVIFESAVILEYLEETQPNPLHPEDPLERARHRSWIELGSAILVEIARLYNAPDEATLEASEDKLSGLFGRVEGALAGGRFFSGERFSLVDAAFAPVFRYFDAFERMGWDRALAGKPGIARWRAALAERPSVRNAVAPDYPERLLAFLARRPSVLGRSILTTAAA